MFEGRSAIEGHAGNARNRELDRQDRARLARRIVARRARNRPQSAVRKGLDIEPGGGLCVLIKPQKDPVLELGHGVPLRVFRSRGPRLSRRPVLSMRSDRLVAGVRSGPFRRFSLDSDCPVMFSC